MELDRIDEDNEAFILLSLSSVKGVNPIVVEANNNGDTPTTTNLMNAMDEEIQSTWAPPEPYHFEYDIDCEPYIAEIVHQYNTILEDDATAFTNDNVENINPLPSLQHTTVSLLEKGNTTKKNKTSPSDTKTNRKKKKNCANEKHDQSIYYFTFDVYKVGSEGTKPGTYVFITPESRYNAQDGAMEWKVEDIVYRERSRRSKGKEVNDYVWFEKATNLMKRDYTL